MKTVNQVAKIARISVRTLHYYDEIGLLKPISKTESGYRLYSSKEIESLWQILFFRELDFPLAKIKDIINNPNFDKNEVLKSHKKLLYEKRKRIDRMINSIDKTISKGFEINMMKVFNMEEIERYKEEVIQKYGNIAKESYKKTSKYNKGQWEIINNEGKNIYIEIAKNMDKDISDEIVQDLVLQWRNYITKYFYDCRIDILQGLGQLYVEDERFSKNIDKVKEGLSIFLKRAIDYYCEHNN